LRQSSSVLEAAKLFHYDLQCRCPGLNTVIIDHPAIALARPSRVYGYCQAPVLVLRCRALKETTLEASITRAPGPQQLTWPHVSASGVSDCSYNDSTASSNINTRQWTYKLSALNTPCNHYCDAKLATTRTGCYTVYSPITMITARLHYSECHFHFRNWSKCHDVCLTLFTSVYRTISATHHYQYYLSRSVDNYHHYHHLSLIEQIDKMQSYNTVQ